MATVTQVMLTCDVCGDAKDVKTWTFELDGQAYVIDLCRKDGNALGAVAAGYVAKARKVTTRRTKVAGQGRVTGSTREKTQTSSTRQKTATSRSGRQAAKVSGAKARAGGVRQQKGIYVYGILPADIEVAAEIPGVGEHPGPLRDVHFDGLAALISEVDLAGRLGSPADLRTHREILDATAAEVPILPLRFGTVLTSEEAVSEELLAAHHDEFTAVLDQLEGRAEFQVKGRYVNDAVTAGREEDTRTLRQAMEGVCVASVAREPAHELDAFHVAFLVAVDKEGEVDRVIEDLAREWEGRIDVQVLGPMAAYDFAGAAQPASREAGRR
jgi:translation elongation factor EF-1beta